MLRLRMARLPQSKLLEGLSSIVGEAHISTRHPDRVAYSADFWPRSQIWKLAGDVERYPPDCIVWPADVDQVAAVHRFLDESGIPIIPYGAGSGVCGGTLPVRGGVIVDTKRMNRLTAVDRTSLTVTAQAGINGMHLEDRLNAHGLTLGHFPSSIMCSTLGGWLAARSAGQFSSRYGKIEDMVMNLEVVLADGRVLDTADRGPGEPDWTQLFVGSEGTLGTITKAQLKVNPAAEAQVFRGYRFRQLSDGFQGMRMVLQAGLKPNVLRLYDPFDTIMASGKEAEEEGAVPPEASERPGLFGTILESAGLSGAKDAVSGKVQPLFQRLKRRAVAGALSVPNLLNRVVQSLPAPCMLIIGFEGDKEQVRNDLWRAGRLLTQAGGSDAGAGPGKAWLEHRYGVSFKASRLYASGAFVDTMEVATTWDRLEGLYKAVVRAIAPHALVMAHFSHAYREGCSIYFTFATYRRDVKRAEHAYGQIWNAALEAAQSAGATASHHHGVGILKKHAMPEEHGEMLSVWRALKDTLDPKGTMNPGKLFPDQAGAP